MFQWLDKQHFGVCFKEGNLGFVGHLWQHPCFGCIKLAKMVEGILRFCMGFPRLCGKW